MATSIDEIAGFLNEAGLKFGKLSDTRIITGFGGLDNYRDPDGDPHLRVAIDLQENGEYVTILAPMAYRVPEEKEDLFFKACMMIQWRTKLVQFEYDATDGEIRPVIEFPLEDAHLTSRQLHRCLHGLLQLIDRYDPVLRKVLEEGVIEFEDEAVDQAATDMLARLLEHLSPEQIAEALQKADLRRRRN